MVLATVLFKKRGETKLLKEKLGIYKGKLFFIFGQGFNFVSLFKGHRVHILGFVDHMVPATII